MTMTPNELLESVKPRFTPLLVVETKTLESLLIKALAAYQDKAGLVQKVRVNKEAGVSLPYPDDYLALVHVVDSRGTLVYSEDFGSSIDLELTGRERYPFTLSYLVNLRDRPLDKWTVPPSTIGMIQDYLEALIAIPNTERQRRVSIAGKLDTSALPDAVTLEQRKNDLELQMAANRAIIAGATLFG
ncbi:hypothetical protein [Serratia sp. JSRIV002]|uniref:hypothetical protein n=1 Tax=Serratia sp. JSRIV002 TaxID=2831894 RepID=UPI001CBF7991|nr:hypothetical protein [Serratia sp. JSRIV002]